MRDSKREPVYQAEYRLRDLFETAADNGNPCVELSGIRMTLPPEARFGSIESIQAYVDRVLAPGELTVRARKGDRWAHYSRADMTIAICDTGRRWAMREIVVLHEVAHHLTHHEHGVVASHGPEFVHVFADLLARTMGPEAGLAYRVLCAHEGVIG